LQEVADEGLVPEKRRCRDGKLRLAVVSFTHHDQEGDNDRQEEEGGSEIRVSFTGRLSDRLQRIYIIVTIPGRHGRGTGRRPFFEAMDMKAARCQKPQPLHVHSPVNATFNGGGNAAP
jgi:hypothetical protein